MHAWAFPGTQLHADASDALCGAFPAQVGHHLYSQKTVDQDKAKEAGEAG